MRARSLLACLITLALPIAGGGAACNQTTTIHGVFVAPESLNELTDEHFFDHPFPSDLRRDPDGKVQLGGMLNPTLNLIVQQYEDATQGLLDGFSPAAAAYFLFDGDLDQSLLPQSPTDALTAQSTVQLIDVDPNSPEHGQRKLIEWYFRDAEGGLYWLPHTLAVAPAHGYPLRPKTKYALVVDARAAIARRRRRVPEQRLDGGARSASRRAARASDARSLRAGGGGGRVRRRADGSDRADDRVHDQRSDRRALRRDRFGEKEFPAPTINPQSWTYLRSTSVADIYEGVYGPSPNYQAGLIPFKNPGDGGGFVFDANGNAVLQSTFTMRFSLVVPHQHDVSDARGRLPDRALRARHGRRLRIRVRRAKADSGRRCRRNASRRWASIRFFTARVPALRPRTIRTTRTTSTSSSSTSYNPIAARTNGRQGAVDVVQQARLFTETHATIPAFISVTHADISFDDTKLLFVGHSQGGVNGPLFLAADDQTRGGVLSGTGAMITVALLEKTQPTPSVAGAVQTLLGLNNSAYDDELNLFHPIINFAQTIVDTTDPLHYMRLHHLRTRGTAFTRASIRPKA